jgi:hypothetical protein
MHCRQVSTEATDVSAVTAAAVISPHTSRPWLAQKQGQRQEKGLVQGQGPSAPPKQTAVAPTAEVPSLLAPPAARKMPTPTSKAPAVLASGSSAPKASAVVPAPTPPKPTGGSSGGAGVTDISCLRLDAAFSAVAGGKVRAPQVLAAPPAVFTPARALSQATPSAPITASSSHEGNGVAVKTSASPLPRTVTVQLSEHDPWGDIVFFP